MFCASTVGVTSRHLAMAVGGADQELLRPGSRAVYNWRGYGMSDRLPDADIRSRTGRDAVAVWDAAGFERAVLWGDASGAAVAGGSHVRYPDRVDRLVLTEGSACLRARL